MVEEPAWSLAGFKNYIIVHGDFFKAGRSIELSCAVVVSSAGWVARETMLLCQNNTTTL